MVLDSEQRWIERGGAFGGVHLPHPKRHQPRTQLPAGCSHLTGKCILIPSPDFPFPKHMGNIANLNHVGWKIHVKFWLVIFCSGVEMRGFWLCFLGGGGGGEESSVLRSTSQAHYDASWIKHFFGTKVALHSGPESGDFWLCYEHNKNRKQKPSWPGWYTKRSGSFDDSSPSSLRGTFCLLFYINFTRLLSDSFSGEKYREIRSLDFWKTGLVKNGLENRVLPERTWRIRVNFCGPSSRCEKGLSLSLSGRANQHRVGGWKRRVLFQQKIVAKDGGRMRPADGANEPQRAKNQEPTEPNQNLWSARRC